MGRPHPPTDARAICFSYTQVTVLEFSVIFAPPHLHSALGPETFIAALLT